MADQDRAKQLVAQMIDEHPEKYAAAGKAFRAEFFEWNGQMLLSIREVEPEHADG